MKTSFDTNTGVTTWNLDKWYQKVAYVVGVFYCGVFLLGAAIGFVGALL